MIGWMAAVALAAPGAETGIDFVGPPACVRLAVESLEAVRLTNGCAGPVLVDQRALRAAEDSPVVPPGAEVLLAGLAAFTLGVDGELHIAVAVSR